MSSRSIITGIDIGTHRVKVVITNAHERDERGFPRIIGSANIESKGLRHGYITNVHDVAASLKQAINEAETKANTKVRRAYLAVGGIGLASVVATSATVISRADLEITKLDMEKVHADCEKDLPQASTLNRRIIHQIPLQYKIDGKVVLGNPLGMRGNRLEVKMLFITCLDQHVGDLIQAVEESGVEVQDVMASPIAASLVTLSKTQKIAGSVLANIGAETVSIAVFENNVPVSLEVFPIGSTDITNDIALGLKVPLEEAEQIKLGAITGSSFPRRKLEEIVYARLSDIFELIEAHLKKIGRSGLLPAGIIITGGGSGIGSIDDMARAALKLPSRIGTLGIEMKDRNNFRDATWAVAYGLTIFGMNADERPVISAGAREIGKIWKNTVVWFKQFLP
jgi:cell division protein FtsA